MHRIMQIVRLDNKRNCRRARCILLPQGAEHSVIHRATLQGSRHTAAAL
jgi:hypothetical protein